MDGDDYSGDSIDGVEADLPRSPAERTLRSSAVRRVQTVCVMVLFFGWVPIVLLTEERHSWNDENAFWWRFIVVSWLLSAAVTAAIAAAERHERRRRLRHLP